jgi:glutathione S-transferase
MFRMLTLYYKPTCPFCRRVLAVVDRIQAQVDLKDVTEDAMMAELVALGGKETVPYLVDAAQGVSLYESDDIVLHLQKHYGGASVPASRPRISISDNVCVSCEG